MFDEINRAIADYQVKWRKLVAGRADKTLFEAAKPTAVGWKVADEAAFDAKFAELRGQCDQVHLKWLNERWIATMVLLAPLEWGVPIVKLMQRRPNSTDALGFDHLDFYASEVADAAAMQTQEPDLKWTDEVNGLCKWTSLWFDGTEAKLRRESVLDVCIAEMTETNKKLLGKQ